MKTAAQIIDELGGTSKVAAALGLTPSTVSSWKTSGSIPDWRRDGLQKIARKLSVQIEGW